jgi:hypothetical protein
MTKPGRHFGEAALCNIVVPISQGTRKMGAGEVRRSSRFLLQIFAAELKSVAVDVFR